MYAEHNKFVEEARCDYPLLDMISNAILIDALEPRREGTTSNCGTPGIRVLLSCLRELATHLRGDDPVEVSHRG